MTWRSLKDEQDSVLSGGDYKIVRFHQFGFKTSQEKGQNTPRHLSAVYVFVDLHGG